MQNFKILKKLNLTHNVYEMDFEAENEIVMKPWQFITFILDQIWGRAYSILSIDWKIIKLIIKKRELDEWGRWWSKYICELNEGDILKWVWPAGHFLLQENKKNKLFIWTWTWLVPLYNMILNQLEKNSETNIYFTFWLREESDVFYLEELRKLKEIYSNFNYKIFISRVKDLYDFKCQNPNQEICSWYTTNFLTKENIKNYNEVYICWAPVMIESTVSRLKELWLKNEDIFFEKY